MAENCANPMLLGWIKEWLDQARERNSKGVTVYKKAYDSMKACPLRFDHPAEAQQLHGLGPKLCDRLVDKLKAHCAANDLPMPKMPNRTKKRQSDGEDDDGVTQPAKRPRKVKPYIPTLRSGAYALVLALSTVDETATQGLTKAETIEFAQPHCDSSFTAPSDPTKFYTAWNSMKTLVGKDLVYERGRPIKRYTLTDDGWDVAKMIKGMEISSVANLTANDKQAQDRGQGRSNATIVPQPSRKASATTMMPSLDEEGFLIPFQWSNPEQIARRTSSPVHSANQVRSPSPERNHGEPTEPMPTFAPILLPPGSFTVHLMLDTREVRTKTDRDYISEELNKAGVKPITRALPLGDALWIAKVRETHKHILKDNNVGDEGDGHDEIVLDHIVERKRLDDLIGSIKDGRFHEQKFRLRRSGVKNVVYIIEDFSISVEKKDKYGEAVSSAIAGTQVVNSYFIKQTAKLDDTIRYLTRMTKMLQAIYEKQDLRVIPSRIIQGKTYLSMITNLRETQPENDHYITFSAFSAICGKSDIMSLRDVFLKMLMCTRGVTGEKALEIQRRWKTPSDFMRAFEAKSGQKSKETMVSEKLGSLIPRKKIAKGLSGKIAEVWG